MTHGLAYPTPGEHKSAAGRIDDSAVAGMMTRAVFLAVLVVFLSEYAFMKVLGSRTALGEDAKALIDAALTSTALLPVLFFVFVRPVVRAARGWAAAERALTEARDELEARVEERTAELAETNRVLRQEVEERREADRKIWYQATLLDAVQQAVLATDMEGRLTYVNRFATELFGWEREAVIGRRLEELRLFGSNFFESACGGQLGEAVETSIGRSDGTAVPALVTVSGIPGPEGGQLGCVFAATEITALKRAEEELRYSEAKYSRLVQQSPTGIFIDRAGKVLFANPAFLEITGRSKESVGTLEYAEIVHPEDRLRPAAVGGEPLAGAAHEYRIVRPDGEVRWVTGRWVGLPHLDGKSLLGNIQDITDRKVAEKNLEASREALRRLSRSLMTAQEDERKRVARELHDSIGQSLSFLYLMVDDFVGDAVPDEHQAQMPALRSLLPKIQEAIDEVRRIFMDLRPSILDDLGLLAAVNWFLRQFQSAAPGIEVVPSLNVQEAAIPEELKIVIFRILQEALSNVARHSDAKRLDVALEIEEGALRLVMMDDGVGFDPMAGSDGEGRRGLGLTSMRERTEVSGGSFQVRTALGRGTIVEAAWPIQPGALSG